MKIYKTEKSIIETPITEQEKNTLENIKKKNSGWYGVSLLLFYIFLIVMTWILIFVFRENINLFLMNRSGVSEAGIPIIMSLLSFAFFTTIFSGISQTLENKYKYGLYINGCYFKIFNDSFSFSDINKNDVVEKSKGYYFLENIENLNRQPYNIEKEIYEKMFRI